MSTNTYSIFDFLKNCGGNWRNTLYIPCGVCIHPCRSKQRGALVTADSYGRPKPFLWYGMRPSPGSGLIRTNASEPFGSMPLTRFSGSSRFGNVSKWEIAFSAAWTAKFRPGRYSRNRRRIWKRLHLL